MKTEFNISPMIKTFLSTIISTLIGGTIVIYSNNIQAERSFNLDKEKIRWELKTKIYEEFLELEYLFVSLDNSIFEEQIELAKRLSRLDRRAIAIFENKFISEKTGEIGAILNKRIASNIDGNFIKSTEEFSILLIVITCMEFELGFGLDSDSERCGLQL